MKKILTLLVFVSFLAGCNTDTTNRYASKEDAIKYGLEQESSNDIGEAILLSVEEYMDETIVFFEVDRALGVASLTKSKEGFSWYRGVPFTGFGGEAPYSTVIFDIETIQGSKISILAGKAFDENIQKIKLLSEGNDEELSISENSRIFYAIYKAPHPSFEIIPIME